MLQDNHPRSAKDLDRLLSAALYQPPAPAGVKARGAARLAALARDEIPARRVRARRAAAAVAALAVAGSAATLAVAVTAGAGGRQSAVALDAFTVTRHGKTVNVTLRDLETYWSARDREALKHKLRAAGVPALIWSRGGGIIYSGTAKPPADLHPRLWCHPAPVVAKIFTDLAWHGHASSRAIAFKIRPRNIPRGARILLVIQTGPAVHGVHPYAFTVPGFLMTAGGRCLSLSASR